MTHSYAWHDTWPSCVMWLIHTCDMTDVYVWCDTCVCVMWRTEMCDLTAGMPFLCDMTHSYACRDLFMTRSYASHDSCPSCVTRPIHVCDMTHSYAWHDWFISVPWLIYDAFVCVTWPMFLLCDMTHSCVRHDSFTYVTWCIHTCYMTHSWHIRMRDMTHVPPAWHDLLCVWHAWFRRVPRLIFEAFVCVTWLMLPLCEMTPSCGWHDAYESTCTKWPRHVCDMTHMHPHMWNDPFICVTWRIWILLYETTLHMCDMMHMNPPKWNDPFICVTWRKWAQTLWNEPCICVTWKLGNPPLRNDSFVCVAWRIWMLLWIPLCQMTLHMCDMTHMHLPV